MVIFFLPQCEGVIGVCIIVKRTIEKENTLTRSCRRKDFIIKVFVWFIISC